MFLDSRWTLQRRVHEYELQEVTGYWTISDEQLDNIVECFMRDHGTLVGHSLVSERLRSGFNEIELEQALVALILKTHEFVGQQSCSKHGKSISCIAHKHT